MQTTRKFIVAGAAALTLVAGGGAAFAVSQSSPEGTPAGAPASTAPARDAAAPEVTAQRAAEIALKEVPGSWVSEVDLDRDGRADVWEVKTIKGDVEHELDIDAGSGEVLKQETERADDDDLRRGNSSDD